MGADETVVSKERGCGARCVNSSLVRFLTLLKKSIKEHAKQERTQWLKKNELQKHNKRSCVCYTYLTLT